MALPIAPTPELKGKDAEKFLKRVQDQENIPVGLVPTPRLQRAVDLLWQEALESANDEE